ncbi:MAG: hypothetical protein P8Y15_01650 [Gemmatimonadales bacterium]
MLRYRLLRSLLMAAVVMVAIPQAANAQAYASKIWSFDVQGGYAIPLGDLKDIAKGGPTFGAGANYFVSDLFSVRLEGSWDLLKGEDVLVATPLGPSSSDIDGGPNITLTHLTGGLDFNFINQPDNPTDTSDLGCEGAPGGYCLIDWQDAYPEFRGGIRLGFEVGDCTPARARICGEISVFGGVHWMFGNEDDTDPITSLYNTSPFGTFQDIPVGLNIRFNVL